MCALFKRNQLHCNVSVVDRHDGDTGWHVESARARGAGIHDHSAGALEYQLMMRVAVDDDIGVGILSQQLFRLWPAELVTVAHVKPHLLERMFESQWKVRVVDWIAVTRHRVDRSYRPELEQDLVAADITCVQDDVHPLEDRVNLGAQETVRVRYQAESDQERASRCGIFLKLGEGAACSEGETA